MYKYCTVQYCYYLNNRAKPGDRAANKVRGEQTSGFLIPTMSVCTCTTVMTAIVLYCSQCVDFYKKDFESEFHRQNKRMTKWAFLRPKMYVNL